MAVERNAVSLPNMRPAAFRRLVAVSAIVSALLPAQNSFVIRSSTRLVEISVIARDANGAADGLGKDDFTLIDRGKQRRIDVFSGTLSKDGAARPEPLPANTFSNRREHRRVQPVSATVVLLDALNTRTEDQTFARQQVVAALRQIEPGENIAVYFLGRSLRVLHDFTSDAQELARMLAHFRGEYPGAAETSAPEPSATGVPAVDAILNELKAGFAYHANVDRALTTLNALEIISNHLAAVPGRKNLIWVSSGFRGSVAAGSDCPPLYAERGGLNQLGAGAARRTFTPEMERVARRANRANLSIYPVDAGGLEMGGRFAPASRSSAAQWPGLDTGTAAAESARATMQDLAAWTGGRAFFDSNGLAGAIRTAIKDAAVTYTLGFYLTASDLDDKFHPVKVRVRRKGVSLGYRKSYVAAVEQPPSASQARQSLLDLLASPVEDNRIPLSMALRAKDGARAFDALLSVDVRGIEMEQQDAKMAAHLQVVFAQQDETGAVLDSSSEPLSFTLDKSTYAQLPAAGVSVGKPITLKEGCTTVRVIVHDRISGVLGSLIVPVSRIK